MDDHRRFHLSPSRGTQSMPKEETFPIPLKYIDVTRTTHASLDVLLEKPIDDYWNADGQRELSDVWTGFTRFILLTERPPDGYTWSRWRLTRKQSTSRRDNVWPDMSTHMSDAAKKKAKRWAIEKPKLDNARLGPPEGFSWSGGRLTRKQTTSRPDNVWPEPN